MSKGKASGGVLLIVAGVWVLAQVLAGRALQRLGVAGGGVDGGPALGIGPDPIPPVPNASPGTHDAHGRPL